MATRYYFKSSIEAVAWGYGDEDTIAGFDPSHAERDLRPETYSNAGTIGTTTLVSSPTQLKIPYNGVQPARFYTPPLMAETEIDGDITIYISARNQPSSSSGGSTVYATIGKRYYSSYLEDYWTNPSYFGTTDALTIARAWTAGTLTLTVSSETLAVGDRIVIDFWGTRGTVISPTDDIEVNFNSQYSGWLDLPVNLPTADIPDNTTMYWNVYTPTTKDTTVHWDTLENIEKDTTVHWDTLGTIQNLCTIHWDVESNLTPITQDATIHWDVIELIEKDTTIHYNTQVGVMQSMVDLELEDGPHTHLTLEAQPWTDLTLEEVA